MIYYEDEKHTMIRLKVLNMIKYKVYCEWYAELVMQCALKARQNAFESHSLSAARSWIKYCLTTHNKCVNIQRV